MQPQLHAPPASLRGTRRPLQNGVLENGLFQPPLRAPKSASKLQAHRHTRGLSARVHRQQQHSSTGAALVRSLSVTPFLDDGLEEHGARTEQ